MKITMDAITQATMNLGRISEAQLFGNCRDAKTTMFRHAAYWLCIKMLGKSYSEAGRHFNRDHSTLVDMVRKVDFRMVREGPDGPTSERIEAIWSAAREICRPEKKKEPKIITAEDLYPQPKKVERVYHPPRDDIDWFSVL